MMTEQEFEKLFHRQKFTLYSLAVSMLNHTAKAEDAVQEAFIKLLKNGGHQTPEGFLVACVKNYCLNQIKHQRRARVSHEEIYATSRSSEEYIESAITKGQLLQQIYNKIEELPPGRKRVMKALYEYDFDVNKVAEKLGISVSTIGVIKNNFVHDFHKPDGEKKITFVVYKGKKKRLSDWCRQFKIPYSTAYGRYLMGWPVEQIFEEAERKKKGIFIHYNGKVKELKEWCQELGIKYKLAYQRYWDDFPAHRILNQEYHSHNKPKIFVHFNGQKKSLRDWCKELNISYITAKKRYYRDLPAHEILGTNYLYNKNSKKEDPVNP